MNEGYMTIPNEFSATVWYCDTNDTIFLRYVFHVNPFGVSVVVREDFYELATYNYTYLGVL